MVGWIIGGAVAACLLVLVAVIIIRTLSFKPYYVSPADPEKIDLDRERIVDDMVEMIKCKTVSNRDEALVDRKEFEKFEKLLKGRFPILHSKSELKKIGKTGLLYKINGKSSDKPSVLMAHYDVVPVEEDGWERPAFDGIIEDGVIWGRGTLDTKGTLCGIVEALEKLLQEGYVPLNDLYLSFSGEEEIDGASCSDIVSYFEENGITPNLVLDEGGAVVENVFPGVRGECALIGIGEKGSVNMNFSLVSKGGHASTPPTHTVVGRLAEAVTKIESDPFPRHFTKPVQGMFDTLGRHSTFLYRMIFANLWCFMPVLDMICKGSGGELNAMMRTTVAVTRFEGSKAYNVLPPKASFGINMRLMEGDTIRSAAERLKKTIGDDEIEISLVNGMNPSICSDINCDAWELIKAAIHDTWCDAIVSPYLMMACSDSRHYCRICDRVYRFSAMKLSKEERGMIHGHNERVPIETLIKTVEFYVRLLKLL